MSDKSGKRFKSYSNYQLWMSGLRPKLGLVFFSVDAKAAIPILGVILFSRNYFFEALSLWLISLAYFLALELLNIPPDIVGSKIRSFIAGKNRYVGNRKLRRGRFTNGR